MLLVDLFRKCVYGTIGYIANLGDIKKAEHFIRCNDSILYTFKEIIVATNYGDIDLSKEVETVWKNYFPKTTKFIHSKINRGHNFGTADLDNMLVDYCKQNNHKWLCKSTNDMLLLSSCLEIPIKNDRDFYYLPGVGYGGLQTYNFDLRKLIREDFYPQTNFYILNIDKIDYVNDKKYLDSTFEQIKQIPKYNGKVWEYIKGWSCESFLRDCITRNKLTKQNLINYHDYYKLLQIIQSYQIHDCSHKNILIDGFCHWHFLDKPIYTIK